jgi:membrane protein required for colicin V production
LGVDYADWVLIGLIVVSTLVGLLRGFIKEVFALAVWVAAFVIAFYFSGQVASLLEGHVELPSGRTAIAFSGLFLIVLVIGGLLTWLIGKLVESTGLSGTDRLMGGVFGALRGLMLVVALVVVAGFTPIPEDPWWKESRVIQSVLPLADWAAGFLPESVFEYFDLYKEAQALETINT